MPAMSLVNPDPTHYSAQLETKKRILTDLLAPFEAPVLDLYSSAPLYYRQRAEFKLWHEGDRSYYAMFPGGKGAPPELMREFPIASLTINRAMGPLLDAIEGSELLRRKLFQVEFLSSTLDDLLITLVYHKPLNEEWEAEARALQASLNCKIIGRSRKQKLVLSSDAIHEVFQVGEKPYHYRQLEGCFSQPNAQVCKHMLNWAVENVAGSAGDLLELYCGNGNFTLPLADHFRKVLATEISQPLIRLARANASENEIKNITFVRLAAEEVTEALQGSREFRRLQGVDLESYEFSTVFVDPPRAGLDDESVKLAQGFERILYISCNPWTLAENLSTLTNTHRIERAALFDQFPYTDHMECGVYLSRR